jgi:uncharacterized membrane protein
MKLIQKIARRYLFTLCVIWGVSLVGGSIFMGFPHHRWTGIFAIFAWVTIAAVILATDENDY